MSYNVFGSTIISVPSEMVGFDKKHHKRFYNTITPVLHKLSVHNKKTSINLAKSDKSKSIKRVPRTTEYIKKQDRRKKDSGGGNGILQPFKSALELATPAPRPSAAPTPIIKPTKEVSTIVNAIRGRLARKELEKMKRKKKSEDVLKRIGNISSLSEFSTEKRKEQREMLRNERLRLMELDEKRRLQDIEEKERQKQINMRNENRNVIRNAAKLLQANVRRTIQNENISAVRNATQLLQANIRRNIETNKSEPIFIIPTQKAVISNIDEKVAVNKISNAYKNYRIRKQMRREKAKRISKQFEEKKLQGNININPRINENRILMEQRRRELADRYALERLKKLEQIDRNQKIIREITSSGEKTIALKKIQRFLKRTIPVKKKERETNAIKKIQTFLRKKLKKK